MVRREDVRRGHAAHRFRARGSRARSATPSRLHEAVQRHGGQAARCGRSLSKRVTGYYGKGNLEALDYELVKDEQDRYGLALTARRNSWGPNYVRFGLNLQDDFEGNSSYNAAARFVLSEITQPGGEWVWDLQVGETSRIATEMYLPLSQILALFLAAARAVRRAQRYGADDEQRPSRSIACAASSTALDFGREFGNWGEIRAGLRRETGSSRVRVGDPDAADGRFRRRAAISCACRTTGWTT